VKRWLGRGMCCTRANASLSVTISSGSRSEGVQPAAVFGGNRGFMVSVDGRPVQGPDSRVSVTGESRVVFYRRRGAALDVLTQGVARRIWLN
jgi:hypothetical protein